MISTMFFSKRGCTTAFFVWSLLLMAVPGHCSAQAFLEQCPSKTANPYFDGVNQVIEAAVQQPASLLLTTFPSFENESGVRLVGNEVVFVAFRSSFWKASYPPSGQGRMDFGKPRIKTDTHRALIDARLARRIENIYAVALGRANKLDQAGLDGVSYRISNSTGACAWAWSPAPRTQNGRLISLISHLERHSKLSAKRDLQRSEWEIKKLLDLIDGL